MTLKHSFTSAIPDTNTPPGAVGPDEWNADHVLSGTDKQVLFQDGTAVGQSTKLIFDKTTSYLHAGDFLADFPVGFPIRDFDYFGVAGSSTFEFAKSGISVNGYGGATFIFDFLGTGGTQYGYTVYAEQRGTSSLLTVDVQALGCPPAGQTINRLTCYESYCESEGPGNITRMSGFAAEPNFNNGIGTIAKNVGFFGQSQAGVGTINAAFYAEDQGTNAADWAFYSEASSKSRFGSVQLGTVSSVTGTLKLAHASSANLTTIQAPNASAAHTLTLPNVTDTLAVLGANTFTAAQTITQASANTGILASTGYSLTGSDATNMLDFAGTWNTSGTPTGLKLLITSTAFNTNSLVASLSTTTGGCYGFASQYGEILIGSSGAIPAKVGLGTAAIVGVSGASVHIGCVGNGGAYLGNLSRFGASARIDDTSIKILNTGAIGWSADGTSYGTLDAQLTRNAAAVIQQGAANAASPVAQTLQAQGSRSGTDSNVAGASYTIQAGQGTGNATGSSLILRAPVAVASGTGAQTMTTAVTITGALVDAAVAVNATAYKVGGTAGADFGPGLPTSITVVKGIITAIS